MEKEKKLKYPIKYAVMPIFDFYYTITTDREYGLVVTIPSKCYVISEEKIYKSDGTFVIRYQVVFTHYINSSLYNGDVIEQIPKFDALSGHSINSTVVEQIFDSYEDALTRSEESNEEILHNRIKRLYFDENYKDNVEILRLEYQEIIDESKKIMELIEQENSNIEVTKPVSLALENLIKRVSGNSADFYIKLAYSLTIEEMGYLKELIENRSCNNCTNGLCKIKSTGRNDKQGSDCLDWDNPELVGRKLVLLNRKN